MRIYDFVLGMMEQAKPEQWHHVSGYQFSYCTINEVEIVLYKNGWINVARGSNNIRGKFPFSLRGRRLYKKVRPVAPTPENEALAKLGYTRKVPHA